MSHCICITYNILKTCMKGRIFFKATVTFSFNKKKVNKEYCQILFLDQFTINTNFCQSLRRADYLEVRQISFILLPAFLCQDNHCNSNLSGSSHHLLSASSYHLLSASSHHLLSASSNCLTHHHTVFCLLHHTIILLSASSHPLHHPSSVCFITPSSSYHLLSASSVCLLHYNLFIIPSFCVCLTTLSSFCSITLSLSHYLVSALSHYLLLEQIQSTATWITLRVLRTPHYYSSFLLPTLAGWSLQNKVQSSLSKLGLKY